MELFEALQSRRSVRSFRPDPVPEDVLKKVIDAGRWAPSACNIQGWRFIVIDDPAVKKSLVERGAASFIEKAPVGILVVYKNQTDNVEYVDHIQSASACIQNMLLAAHAMGLGGCWICHLPGKSEIRRLLGIPSFYDPVAYVALGYPAGQTPVRARLCSVDALISHNRFEAAGEQPKSRLRVGLRRLARKAYYMMPYRKYIARKVDDCFEKRFD